MKNLFFLFVASGILMFSSSCEKQDILNDLQPDESSSLKSAAQSATQGKDKGKGHAVMNFRTHLSGKQEVPANASKATGQAIFQLSKDGLTLSYKLIVANIENVTMAHIHLAPAGANGGVVAWLYPSGPPAMLLPGKTNGILHQGTITGGDLRGALAGQELGALIEHIKNGNAYVNVHTAQFPGGEIRGQIWGN